MGSESTRHVPERTGKLENAKEVLPPTQQVLNSQLDATDHLQRVATQLISVRGTEVLYEQILDTALAILQADFASIQKFCPERGVRGELRLLGHRGFSPEAAKRWQWVGPTAPTTCGEALRSGHRIAVADVRSCDFMAGSDGLEEYQSAEIRAGLTTPLVSRSGALMGMVSVYWREPHKLSMSESRTMDVLARMAADLIERSLAEDRLVESAAHLKRAERIARLGHWQWDLQSNVVSGSEEMYRIFGKPADYVPSYDGFLNELIPRDRERVERLIKDSLETKVGHSIEYRIRLTNGDVKTISCAWEVLLDDDGVPVRIFGTCQDITDSRRAQEEAFARQKLESLGVLANGIAHDFNNLLGGVLAQAELAQSDYAAGESPESQLQAITKLAVHGAEVLRQLMIYAGVEDPAVGWHSVSQVVMEMLELFKISVSKYARLEMDLARDLPPFRANAAQIRQIVLNLVTNASDAIGNQAGVIRVSTRNVSIRSNKMRDGLASGNYILLEVTDTGCGMAPETRAKMFDPFFTTKSPGRGLGLAVVQGAVRALRGTVQLTSEPAKGTKFQVFLPCARHHRA